MKGQVQGSGDVHFVGCQSSVVRSSPGRGPIWFQLCIIYLQKSRNSKPFLSECPINGSSLKLFQPTQHIFTKHRLGLLFAYIVRCPFNNAPFQFAVGDICPLGEQVFWTGDDPFGVFFREES